MKKSLLYVIALSALLTLGACGDKKSENNEKVTSEQPKDEGKKNVSAISSDRQLSEMAKKSDVQLEFTGFINRSYENAIDVMAQEMFKDGPALISITFDMPEDGGGSVALSAPKFETGVYEMTGEAMKTASLASDKFMFKSKSGTLEIINISDDFIEGRISNVVFEESTNYGADNLKLVSGSFKIPLRKK